MAIGNYEGESEFLQRVFDALAADNGDHPFTLAGPEKVTLGSPSGTDDYGKTKYKYRKKHVNGETVLYMVGVYLGARRQIIIQMSPFNTKEFIDGTQSVYEWPIKKFAGSFNIAVDYLLEVVFGEDAKQIYQSAGKYLEGIAQQVIEQHIQATSQQDGMSHYGSW